MFIKIILKFDCGPVLSNQNNLKEKFIYINICIKSLSYIIDTVRIFSSILTHINRSGADDPGEKHKIMLALLR